MVADNGPLYAYVDIPLKLFPPATIVIYNINNVYTIFDQFDVILMEKNKDISKWSKTFER